MENQQKEHEWNKFFNWATKRERDYGEIFHEWFWKRLEEKEELIKTIMEDKIKQDQEHIEKIYPKIPCDTDLCSCQYNPKMEGFDCSAPHLISNGSQMENKGLSELPKD